MACLVIAVIPLFGFPVANLIISFVLGFKDSSRGVRKAVKFLVVSFLLGILFNFLTFGVFSWCVGDFSLVNLKVFLSTQKFFNNLFGILIVLSFIGLYVGSFIKQLVKKN